MISIERFTRNGFSKEAVRSGKTDTFMNETMKSPYGGKNMRDAAKPRLDVTIGEREDTYGKLSFRIISE
jgi:hypothetical protein